MWNVSSSRCFRADRHWSLECSDTVLLCPDVLLELKFLGVYGDLKHQELPRSRAKGINVSCKVEYQPVHDKSSTRPELFSMCCL